MDPDPYFYGPPRFGTTLFVQKKILEARIWIQIRIRVKSWIQIQNSICVKKRIPIRIQIRIRVINLIRIRIKVRWIHNTVPNRAGFESNYESDSSFFYRCCSGLWSYVIDFFIFHSWIYLVHKVLSRFKKKSNLLHVQFACAHIFFLCGNVLKKCRRDINCSLDYGSSWVKNSIISPTKIEQHFGGYWNFETPLMLLSLSQKVVHSMRWKICFFFQYTVNSFGMYVL